MAGGSWSAVRQMKATTRDDTGLITTETIAVALETEQSDAAFDPNGNFLRYSEVGA